MYFIITCHWVNNGNEYFEQEEWYSNVEAARTMLAYKIWQNDASYVHYTIDEEVSDPEYPGEDQALVASWFPAMTQIREVIAAHDLRDSRKLKDVWPKDE